MLIYSIDLFYRNKKLSTEMSYKGWAWKELTEIKQSRIFFGHIKSQNIKSHCMGKTKGKWARVRQIQWEYTSRDRWIVVLVYNHSKCFNLPCGHDTWLIEMEYLVVPVPLATWLLQWNNPPKYSCLWHT